MDHVILYTLLCFIFLVQKAFCVLLCGFSTCDFVFLTLIQQLSKQPISTWQVVRTTTSFSWWSQYIWSQPDEARAVTSEHHPEWKSPHFYRKSRLKTNNTYAKIETFPPTKMHNYYSHIICKEVSNHFPVSLASHCSVVHQKITPKGPIQDNRCPMPHKCILP